MTRKERRAVLQMVEGIRMECNDCGARVAPEHIAIGDCWASYLTSCTCGAVLIGIIGPPEVVAAFHANMRADLEADGVDRVHGVVRPLPDGWPDSAHVH
jgi:hypothetical protein